MLLLAALSRRIPEERAGVDPKSPQEQAVSPKIHNRTNNASRKANPTQFLRPPEQKGL